MLAAHAKIYSVMQQLQVLTHEFKDHPWIPGWINAGHDILFVNEPMDIVKTIPVVCGSDLINDYVRHWLNVQQPAVYIGRGYVGNHTSKQRRLWRMSMNAWANTVLRPIPYSRWDKMQLPRHPWKVKKIQNVLIAPSKLVSHLWSSVKTHIWAESLMDKFPGAEVKIRYKASTPGERWSTLWDDLDWADLVVTQSSAITCEAFWYGKKVISIEPCPTWAAEHTRLEDWQNPHEPELRDIWHEHLAWSQFTIDEWASGEALSLVEQYMGPVMNYDPGHGYNFSSTITKTRHRPPDI
jgi:hypothetical protein